MRLHPAPALRHCMLAHEALPLFAALAHGVLCFTLALARPLGASLARFVPSVGLQMTKVIKKYVVIYM